jgi:hypothetical protein
MKGQLSIAPGNRGFRTTALAPVVRAFIRGVAESIRRTRVLALEPVRKNASSWMDLPAAITDLRHFGTLPRVTITLTHPLPFRARAPVPLRCARLRRTSPANCQVVSCGSPSRRSADGVQRRRRRAPANGGRVESARRSTPRAPHRGLRSPGAICYSKFFMISREQKREPRLARSRSEAREGAAQ